MEYEYDTFISFNKLDKALAQNVYNYLTERGMKVFFADDTLRKKGKHGSARELEKALRSSRNFLLVATKADHFKALSDKNPDGSHWVEAEIEEFLGYYNKRTSDGLERGALVSFRAKAVERDELPLGFKDPIFAIVYNEDDPAASYEELYDCQQNGARRAGVKRKWCKWLKGRKRSLDRLEKSLFNPDEQDAGLARISEMYVSLPIDSSISVTVKGGQAGQIYEERTSDGRDVENGKYESMRTAVNSKIRKGIEYRFQEPAARPKILSPVWSDGLKRDFWRLNAIDAISVNRKTAVLGDPGMGKSTLLRFLYITLADQYGSNQNMMKDWSLSDEFHRNRYFPVFMEFSKLIPWLEERYGEDAEKASLDMLAEYIYETQGDEKNGLTEADARDMLRERSIFLLDGLDEISAPSHADGVPRAAKARKDPLLRRKKTVIALIENIERISPKNKIVVSCRQRDYSLWALPGAEEARLQLMDEPAARRLVLKICEFYKREDRSAELLARLKALRVDEKLLGNPLLLSLATELFLDGTATFPENKSKILEESIRLLLKRKPDRFSAEAGRASETFNQSVGLEQIVEILEKIAYRMQTQPGNGGLSIAEGDLIGVIYSDGGRFGGITPDAFLRYLQNTTGVMNVTDRRFEFAHRHFQEFLCASYLSRLPPTEQIETIKNGLLTAPAKWAEPCLLFCEILLDKGRKNDLWSLLYKLTRQQSAGRDTENAGWLVWFMASALSVRDFALLPALDKDYDDRNDATLRCLRTEIVRLLREDKTVSLAQRIECAKFLGMIGDDREGVGLEPDDGERGDLRKTSLGDADTSSRLPRHSWVPVGTRKEPFIMGTTDNIREEVARQISEGRRWGKDAKFDRETPPKEVEIAPFRLSKYQTTNEQFLSFVHARDGYRNERWWRWCNAAWNWFRQNNDDGRISRLEKNAAFKLNYPVTCVNFFEASAYCLWFSAKTGKRIRMPSEGEWEYAAKARGGLFSWGDQFDSSKCNSSYSQIGDIVPVGVFPPTAREEVPCDMNGNVWEWCQSVYPAWESDDESLTGYDETKNFIDTNQCYELAKTVKVAVRGGSFLNPPALLRNTFRGRDRMEDSFYRQGFRVLMETEPHPSEIPKELICKLRDGMSDFKPGAGKVITEGDHVSLAYMVYASDNRLVENKMSPENVVKVRIGAGELNAEIERRILEEKMSVATTFSLEIQVRASRDAPDERYLVKIYIQESS